MPENAYIDYLPNLNKLLRLTAAQYGDITKQIDQVGISFHASGPRIDPTLPNGALIVLSEPSRRNLHCGLYELAHESVKADIKEAKVEMPCRSFTEFEYSTLNSWTKARRVIGKAEILPKGDNPRFIVTNLPEDGWNDPIQAVRFQAAALYEKFYCARGDMENRIKEQQMDLFADRTSTHWLASNQLRLWFSAFAHLIMSTLQAGVLKGTELESASIGQIRLRLFKIAARLKTSARRIHIELCSAYPLQALFSLVHQRLSALGSPA